MCTLEMVRSTIRAKDPEYDIKVHLHRKAKLFIERSILIAFPVAH